MSIYAGGKPKGEGAQRALVRRLPRILLLSALLAGGLSASPIIQYQITTNGATATYQYFVSGFDFLVNQELDIQFGQLGSSNIFGLLSNGKAPAGFDVMLFQPNNPPQAPGDYSALAVVDHPSLSGPFSVDVTLTGTGVLGSQFFTISQFDSNGMFVSVLASGSTEPQGSDAPEPASFWPCGMAFVIAGVFWARRALA
jgi:hypothetical protein